MQTLAQTVRLGEHEAGDPFPRIHPYWQESFGVDFRRGRLVMIVGGPGAGKSAVALHFVTNWKVPTLYISADTDQGDMTIRTVALVTGQDQQNIAARWDVNAAGYLDVLDREAGHIEWCWDSSPSMADVLDELYAYGMVYGEWPACLVIDNVMNVNTESGDDWQAARDVALDAQRISREMNMAVLLLHHTTGSYEDNNKPIPLSGSLGKVGKMPQIVLTITRHESNMDMYVVKNRSGRADPAARQPYRFIADMSTMQIAETTPHTTYWSGVE